jgi:hypothetical protein
MAVAARDPQGRNVDFAPDTNVSIEPHTAYVYTKTQTMLNSGKYTMWVVNYSPGRGWSDTYPSSASNVQRSVTPSLGQNPAITTGLSLSPANPAVGQLTTVTFTITNDGDVAMPVNDIAVAVRGPKGQNVDYGLDKDVMVPAGGTYTYSKVQSFAATGTYAMAVANYRASSGWSSTLPASATPSTVRSLNFSVKPNPRVTGGLSLSPASPQTGQNVTATFQIRNDSESPVNVGLVAVAARDAQNRNVDFAPDTAVTIPANSTYTYSKSRTFTAAGKHTVWVVNYRPETGWSSTYLAADSNSILTLLSPTITTP